MGIHHTYKAQRGERDKQMERQRRSRNRQLLKKQEVNNDSYVVPEGVTLTLDMITDPTKNGKI